MTESMQDGPSAYAGIWEQEGRWILGPHVLAQIVRCLQGRSLVAVFDPADPSHIVVTLPLPEVHDGIGGRSVCISEFVPQRLRPIMEQRFALAGESRRDALTRLMDGYLGTKATPETLAQVNADLAAQEAGIRHREGRELWQDVAEAFGLDPLDLPRDAFS